MEYTIKLTQEELNIVAQGLGELPLKASMPVWSKLNAQAVAQEQPIPISAIGKQVGDFVPNEAPLPEIQA